MELENEIIVREQNEVNGLDFTSDNIMALARQAEERIVAVKKIMNAALMITNENDWVLIGGKPYLQETGASKVARLFGISWKIENPQILVDNQGYKTYIFKGTFSMNNDSIEAEGSRSMKDDFFVGRGTNKKSIDEIDERDVRMSAYTNCINNGIKRLVPGIRNLKLEDLEKANLDTKAISGYTFKTGSQGGTQPAKAETSGVVCEICGASVTQRVASYSQGQFGRVLCMSCQKQPPVETQGE